MTNQRLSLLLMRPVNRLEKAETLSAGLIAS
jgi:hypothetical protein